MGILQHLTVFAATIAVGGLLFGTTGCVSTRNQDKVRTTRLERDLRKMKAQNETLREKNSVLKQRIKLMEAGEIAAPGAPEKPLLSAFPEPVNTRSTDHALYQAVRDHLSRGDAAEATRIYGLLLKSYPNSPATKKAGLALSNQVQSNKRVQ